MTTAPAPLTPDDLLALLARHGVAQRTVSHEAVFTVAQSSAVERDLPGGHVKNLFLKDKKGAFFLVTAHAHARIDLKRLHQAIGASGRVSFGSAEQLRAVLGVEPGSVTPYAVVNDRERRVRFFVDRTLLAYEVLNAHPLVNTMTTAVAREDLLRFLDEIGHPPQPIDLPVPEDDASVAREADRAEEPAEKPSGASAPATPS